MLFPMTFDQAAILVLLVAMLAVFALDRLRMEVVALGGLAIAALLGLVPASGVFAGFADPAVITVIEILLMVQALGRSAAMEGFSARLSALKLSPAGTIFVLCLAAAGLSVFMNNIGALALMIPQQEVPALEIGDHRAGGRVEGGDEPPRARRRNDLVACPEEHQHRRPHPRCKLLALDHQVH